jgi:UDP-glucose:(heptosyl)LPS alpha-1,3-glucosyltransferase
LNRLIKELHNHGIKITAFLQDTARAKEIPGVKKVIKIPVLKLCGALRRYSFNYFAKRCVSKHRKNIDLLLTTGKVTFGDVHRCGGGVHAEYIKNCLSPLKAWKPKHLAACHLQKRLFEKSQTELIFNSEMVKKQVLNRYNVSEDRINVIYNGIDTKRFTPEKAREKQKQLRSKYGYKSDDFVCLFTAGGWGRKGAPELLRAFSSLSNKSIKLLIVGNTDQEKLEKEIEKYKLSDSVIYAGYQKNIEYFYGASDCLVFPSKYDAGGNVVLEAMACGLPVITTETTGFASAITNGKHGYVIESAEDWEKLADKIMTLASSDDMEEMSKNAHREAQKYSMSNHFKRFFALLEKVHKT